MGFDFERHGAEARERYLEIRPTYALFAEKLRTLIQDLLANAQIVWQTVNPRAKDPDSFREKAMRVREKDPSQPKYPDPLTDIEDLAAVRIVTYFGSDVSRAAALIRNEFVLVGDRDIREELIRESRLGYQSVHFVVRLSPLRAASGEWRPFAQLKAEIQIRTVLQHAWAEIEHDIQYKSGVAAPPAQRKRFLELAGLIEIADREFEAIRTEYESVRAAEPLNQTSDESDKVPPAPQRTTAQPVDATIDHLTLKRYLDDRLGADPRMSDSAYRAAAGLLGDLGFRHLSQIDPVLESYNDDRVSRVVYGSRQGQIQRFEAILLAALGDTFITRHPWAGQEWFQLVSHQHLSRLKASGLDTGRYNPAPEE